MKYVCDAVDALRKRLSIDVQTLRQLVSVGGIVLLLCSTIIKILRNVESMLDIFSIDQTLDQIYTIIRGRRRDYFYKHKDKGSGEHGPRRFGLISLCGSP